MSRDISKNFISGSSQFDKEKNYWLKKFAGEVTKSCFPYDYTGNDICGFAKDTIEFRISGDLFSRLNHLTNRSDNNLFVLLAAGLNILLSRYTGNSDIIIGCPVLKQDVGDEQGKFLNTLLAIRITLLEKMTFKELLLQVKQTFNEANENSNYPLQRLLYYLGLPKVENGSSLFETVILLQNIHDRRYIEKMNHNMMFLFQRGEQDIEGVLEYNTHLYRRGTLETILSNLLNVLQNIFKDLNAPVSDIDILAEKERHQLLVTFNNTCAHYPRDKTVHELFEEQVKRTPDFIAAASGDSHFYGASTYTYTQLNQKSNQLAGYLRKKRVGPDRISGIMVGPSLVMVIGIMAVLKAGGAYLPIDHESPGDRMGYLLSESRCSLLLTQRNLMDKVKTFKREIITIDDERLYSGANSNLPGISRPQDLFYTIYTSGTTGRPKGGLLTNRNLVNYVTWFSSTARLTEKDKTIMTASFAFDLGYTTFWGSLLTGGQLHLISKEMYINADTLLGYIKEKGITYLKMTPSLFSVLVNNPGFSMKNCSTLRLVVLGGEGINTQDVEIARHRCSHLEMMNHYGPTETTIGSVARFIDFNELESYKKNPSIGTPIHNTEVYILNKHLRSMPIGARGEIFIGGDGVGRGYMNRPELSSARFITNPWAEGEHLYRTGDLARWLPCGNIEFLGRKDNQVKIRGFRIELGEIENQLLKSAEVRDVVVIAKEDPGSERYLCAYVVPSSPEASIGGTQLKELLSGNLPDFMIPAHFIIMDAIPLTPNGKVDRKALPSPEFQKVEKYIAPRDRIEARLVELWGEGLQIEKNLISVDSNFFELGGHSLNAAILVSRMHEAFDVNVPIVSIFEKPTVEELAAYIKTSTKDIFASMQLVEEKGYYPLSSAQNRLYVLQRMEPEAFAYNIYVVMELKGELHREKFENAFKKLILRHESLRTSFRMLKSMPVQRIHQPAEIEFRIQYNEQRAVKAPEDIEPLVKGFIRAFDLSQAPLIRVGLIQTLPFGQPSQEENPGDKYILIVDMHHIITDGISQSLLIEDFMALYAGKELPALKLQYKDYSQWQNSLKGQEARKKQEAYWLKEFKEEIPVLNLPTDFSRPAVQSFEGTTMNFTLDLMQKNALEAIASAQDATIFMVLLALFNVFLFKLSAQEVITVGTPVVGRRHVDLERIIGIFINTLVLKNYTRKEKRFTEFLTELKQNALAGFENQDYQFENLVDKVVLRRDTSRNPLFDVMFSYRSRPDLDVQLGDMEILPYNTENRFSKFDLSLDVSMQGDNLFLTFEYSTKLFKKETIVRFITYFKKVVSAVVNNREIRLSEIRLISEEEKRQMMLEFNNTAGECHFNKMIHELFEEQVERTSSNIAVVAHRHTQGIGTELVKQEITYKELNRKSNQLARKLRNLGVVPDTIVGIMVEPSIEMVVAIIAVLKSGGAYLPIDSQYPVARIDYLLKDSKIHTLLINKKILCDFEFEGGIIDLRSPGLYQGNAGNPGNINTPEDLAYVIYTSGSTGKPKGVVITHRNLLGYLNAFYREFEITADDTFLQQASFSFDAFVEEFYPVLLRGGKLAISAKYETLDIHRLSRFFTESHVTMISCSPLLLNELNKLDSLEGIHTVISGGDVLRGEYVSNFLKNGKVYNTYGPTETTVCATYYRVHGESAARIPIGKPISNYKVYILDQTDQLQPLGVPGELGISGIGIARGYLNRPELTAEKFDHDFWDYQDYHDEENKSTIKKYNQKFLRGGPGGAVFSKSAPSGRRRQRLYKSGDLARWLPDGNIEFLGRIDQQIKIKGYRIELGEIEACLLTHSEITGAAVIEKEDTCGDKCLCAYVVSGLPLAAARLREYLSEHLPNYMIPAYFMQIEKIPVTASGKTNRAALPDPQTQTEPIAGYAPPRNEIEEKLVEIWQKVLLRNPIGIHDNFFMVGGDSIKTIQIASRMNMEGYKLEMVDFFRYPTISELESRVKKSGRIADQSVITGKIPLTPIQEEFFPNQTIHPHHYNHAVMLYSEERLKTEAVKVVFQKIQDHHDALRITFKRNKGGEIIQHNHGVPYPLALQEFDLSHPANYEDMMETLENRVNEIQASIDLEKGPLMKVGLFHLEDGDRLLIVIHHLVVDGISWRILFEDIGTLYRQYEEGKPLKLPSKTDSFKVWAEKLVEYANSESFLKEKKYWEELDVKQVLYIKKDFGAAGNQVKDEEHLSFTLSNEETNLLLTRVNNAFGTEVNDILLTALGLGTRKLYGHDRLLVALEGHGREEIIKDIHIHRTVGWFTSCYPVVLDMSFAHDLGRQIKEIKENLHRIPHKGIGYGIFKYLTAAEHRQGIDFTLKPQISFNYLGQFDAEAAQTSFGIAKESTGNTKSISGQREYELDIAGMIIDNRLVISIHYNRKHYKAAAIESLLESYKIELSRVISYCASKEEKELTPADLTYSGLSIEKVEQLAKQYPIEDIYTLSPMQEGKLFYTLYNEDTPAGFVQMTAFIAGELDLSLFQRSVNVLFERHDILRTVFVYEDVSPSIQVVLRERPVEVLYKDLRDIPAVEDKQEFIEIFKEKDRQRSFDLRKDVLMHFAVFQTGDTRYQIIWSYHHILMDGWCLGIIFREFLELYNSFAASRPDKLEKATPYKKFIQWLDTQEKGESKRYWKRYLEGFQKETGIPGMKGKDKEANGNGYKLEQQFLHLKETQTNDINRLAVDNQVTLNTVIQAVWGVILSHYNRNEDVVFGAVVSGRPSDIPGIESMMGLFINTIPVRIRCKAEMTFNDLLRQVQESALNSDPHHHYPLARIQAESQLKRNLIGHILVFENLPTSELVEGTANGNEEKTFQLEDLSIFIQPDYQFQVVIRPGDPLSFEIRFNALVHDANVVKRIAFHIEKVLDTIIDNPDIQLKNIRFPGRRPRAKSHDQVDYTSDFGF